MESAVSKLPEELILRVFHHLDALNDLWTIMLTCKQFHRISLDIKPWKITELAFHTGSYFPALQPIHHILLLASARRLSEWAREDEIRQTWLKSQMQGGVYGLMDLASEVVPIGLQELCEVAAWRGNFLVPLSETLERSCGPASKALGEEYLSVCEVPDLALLAWAIYGELFDHMMCLERLDPKKKLDSVTRFRFMVYCVPDVNCFNHSGISPPAWFVQLGEQGERSVERFQQLSLRRAMEHDLSESNFSACLQQLTGLDLGDLGTNTEGPITPDTCGAVSLFVLIVINSGRRALEVLQMANMARDGRETNTDDILAWLRDIWTRVNQACDSASGSGVPKLINTEDCWLKRHFAFIGYDIEYTWQGYIPYDLKEKDSMSREELEAALIAELQP